ncbi:MAG: DUF4389 domain-containing protein, partial [Gammaproteobacteria bacterium]|nr:DUF4389 domain-containing protein [Gammaproteobacteria bacterium]
LMFTLFYSVAEFVMFFVVVFQFLLVLFTGETNPRLKKLGQSIATYIYQIIQYLTFNSDYQSYPFGAWPKGEPLSLKNQKLKSDSAEKDTD